MQVELKPRESVEIVFKDSDGVIKIIFSSTAICVKADLPDTKGRRGVIYEEIFAGKRAPFDFGGEK